MYAGVLLVYTKIIAYCPTAQPPTRDVVFALVDENNKDKSSGDTISEEEFEELSADLCTNIAGRVTIEFVFALIVAPLVGAGMAYALDYCLPQLSPRVLFPEYGEMLLAVRLSVFVSVLLMSVVPRLTAWWNQLTTDTDLTIQKQN